MPYFAIVEQIPSRSGSETIETAFQNTQKSPCYRECDSNVLCLEVGTRFPVVWFRFMLWKHRGV